MQGHPEPIDGGAPPRQDVNWSTRLLDCCSDCSDCCLALWCPCIPFGRIAEIIDRGTTSCLVAGGIYTLIRITTCSACIYAAVYKNKMRHQYNLKGDSCTDCLSHFCCEPCALTQEYRELKNRGFDMSLGWQGNLDRQNTGVAMGAPVAEQGMKR